MSKRSQKLGPGGLIAVAVIALTLGLYYSGMLTTLENISYDWRMKTVRSEVAAPDEVAVILIDEASLRAMDPLVGRWPWPRSVQADVIDFLALGNPRAIVFDILFSEADATADDQRLAQASADAGNVIHAMQLYRDSEDEVNSSMLDRPLPAAALVHAVGQGSDSSNNVFSLPLPGLLQASAALGVVTTDPDKDGVYRHSRLWHDYQGHRFASLGAAPLPPAKYENLAADLQVNYYGHMDTYSMSGVLASAQQLLNGEVDNLMVDPFEFQDKIVFIGASAVGLEDLKTTPLAANTPGVVLHASVTANLLSGDLLKAAPHGFTLASVIVAALLVCLLVLNFNSIWLKSLAPLVCASLYVVLAWSAFRQNLVLEMAPPLLAMVLAAVFSSTYLLFTEGRDKRRVRTMLGQYVSPAVLSTVVDTYEDHLSAEVGSEEELSILFSDIRGFTSMSEAMPPDKVVEMLNHYFSAMTEAIFERRGTIDKFIGDAIMAFWGAPLREAQHADLALQAAMEMHARLKQVNEWLQAHDYPLIQVGIGIHTGPVILGNIGSVQKLDYTIIGDNVNLASRLEGLTKQYGATIVISEMTYHKLQQPVPCYVLDLVRVKGKQVPIRIYAPILDLEQGDAERQAELCQRAFDAYLQQQWQAAVDLYQQLPEGVLRSTFAERCRSYQQQPPEQGWDGVFTMTSK
jgi:adenylate cyclase